MKPIKENSKVGASTAKELKGFFDDVEKLLNCLDPDKMGISDYEIESRVKKAISEFKSPKKRKFWAVIDYQGQLSRVYCDDRDFKFDQSADVMDELDDLDPDLNDVKWLDYFDARQDDEKSRKLDDELHAEEDALQGMLAWEKGN